MQGRPSVVGHSNSGCAVPVCSNPDNSGGCQAEKGNQNNHEGAELREKRNVAALLLSRV